MLFGWLSRCCFSPPPPPQGPPAVPVYARTPAARCPCSLHSLWCPRARSRFAAPGMGELFLLQIPRPPFSTLSCSSRQQLRTSFQPSNRAPPSPLPYRPYTTARSRPSPSLYSPSLPSPPLRFLFLVIFFSFLRLQSPVGLSELEIPTSKLAATLDTGTCPSTAEQRNNSPWFRRT